MEITQQGHRNAIEQKWRYRSDRQLVRTHLYDQGAVDQRSKPSWQSNKLIGTVNGQQAV